MGVTEEAEAVSALTAAGAPSVGLVHAAGMLADALLANQTPARVRRVFAPKAAAERALSQVTLPPLSKMLFGCCDSQLASPCSHDGGADTWPEKPF